MLTLELQRLGEALDTAGPGETVTMSGANFLPGSTKFDIFSQTAGYAASLDIAEPLLISRAAASALMPESLPPWSMYLVWPNNNGIRGKPFAVNRTDAWWIGPNVATAGQSISIFGRNLSKSNGNELS